MLKIILATLAGIAGFAVGYYFHQILVSPATCTTTWASPGSPEVTGAIVGIVATLAVLVIIKK